MASHAPPQALSKHTPMTSTPKFDIVHSQKCCLFVGNISYDCTEETLAQCFARIGGLVQFKILKDAGSASHRGYGFLEFNNEESAALCYRTLNGTEFYGRPLRLDPGDVDVRNLEMLGATRQRDLADLQAQMIGAHSVSLAAEAAHCVATTLSLEQLCSIVAHGKAWQKADLRGCRSFLVRNPDVAFALQYAQMALDCYKKCDPKLKGIGLKDLAGRMARSAERCEKLFESENMVLGNEGGNQFNSSNINATTSVSNNNSFGPSEGGGKFGGGDGGGKQPWKFEDYQRKGGAAGAGKSVSWGWGGGDEWAGKAYGKSSRIGPYGKE